MWASCCPGPYSPWFEMVFVKPFGSGTCSYPPSLPYLFNGYNWFANVGTSISWSGLSITDKSDWICSYGTCTEGLLGDLA